MPTATKQLDLSVLSPSARRELLDFYDFLKSKYARKNKPISKTEQARLFCENASNRSLLLPADYRFNRDEIYDR